MDAPRLNLLIAESGRTLGGTERVVWELATRLPAARYDVRVWLSPEPAVDELAAALEARGLGVDRVAEVESRWDWRGMLDTWRRLRALRPTLLHVHHVWPSADRYLPALARAAGVPHLVVTEHLAGHPNSPAQTALKGDELRRAAAVTAVSEAVAATLVRDYGIPRDLVRVVPNGADAPDEEAEWREAQAIRESLGATSRRPLWVCAGRLERQKGHDVLLEALARLQGGGFEFVVALAGDGTERAALEERAAALGLASRVHFLGALEVVGPLLAAADVVVLPSRWEGLPLTLLEAMARARPVVASAVGGVPEVMEDGVHGALVPSEDPEALAGALAALHARPETARQLGRRAAERVRSRYTWERVVESFEAVYDEVLGLATFAPAADPAARARRGGGR